ncbi:MAG: hypothetical protein CL680_21415 [Blastomonas sp.]|nr:hypothetical protein [Blastomonas sp.]|tara:strand:- start:11142 stop:12449 length:1308 start_codon:yes stop_codon:yes gene_type:complete
MGITRKATFYTSIFFVLSQLLRLSSNLVVARWLAPDIYAVAAFALIIRQGIQMMSDVGLSQYILKHEDHRNKEMLDTVWTMQVIRGVIFFTISLVIAYGIWNLQQINSISLNGLHSSPQLPVLVAVMSFICIFDGFKPLSKFIYGREMNVLKPNLIELICQFFGCVTMIVWAYLSPSVWALASAAFVNSFLLSILTWALFETRHSFWLSSSIMVEVKNFGKWILLSSALTFVAANADRLFLSALLEADDFGLYSITLMFIGLATTFFYKLTNSVLLPALSNVRNTSAFGSSFYNVTWVSNLVVGVATVIGGSLAPYMIKLVYDARYHAIGTMLQYYLPTLILLSALNLNNAILMIQNKTKVHFAVMLLRVTSLALILPFLFEMFQLNGVFISVFLTNLIALLAQYYYLYKIKVLRFKFGFFIPALFCVLYVCLIF